MSTLREYFTGSACKYLSNVDVSTKTKPASNQHEIGSNKFTAILGDPGSEKLRFKCTFLYFPEDAEEALFCSDNVTYYDTRFAQPGRAPEFRLYYRDNAVTEKMAAGDFCLVAVRTNGELLIVIARAGSHHERRIRYLFGVDSAGQQWLIASDPDQHDVDLATSTILGALGIESTDAADDLLGQLIDRFGNTFPKTKELSEYARSIIAEQVSPIAAPDEALELWMQYEERLFRTIEKVIVEERLASGFTDVDDFVSYSLSVHNRRKSRVGYALEHHLEAIFRANGIRYQRGAITEGTARPDFLFPGLAEYRDPSISSPPLRMLASKSSCKDRWRQVLPEAARIPEKHLCTLETAISENQTREMQAHRVRLVVPTSVRKTYSSAQQGWLLSLKDFVELVRI